MLYGFNNITVLPRVNIEYLCLWETLTYVVVNREKFCKIYGCTEDKILVEDAKYYDSLFSSWKGVDYWHSKFHFYFLEFWCFSSHILTVLLSIRCVEKYLGSMNKRSVSHEGYIAVRGYKQGSFIFSILLPPCW